MREERTLAQRLGQSVHVSGLRRKIARLMKHYPTPDSETMEDWLLDVANLRGVKSVSRSLEHLRGFSGGPGLDELSNVELIVAICQPHNRDRPQWLRAAAELISRRDVDFTELIQKARMEKAERILAELARQALIAEPRHDLWRQIREAFIAARPLSDSLIHWTRLTTKKAGKDNRFSKFIDRPLAR